MTGRLNQSLRDLAGDFRALLSRSGRRAQRQVDPVTEQQCPEPIDVAALGASMAEDWCNLRAAMETAVTQTVEAFRPLLDLMEAHPLELLEWEPEKDVPNCHHLCGRTVLHECTGEATTTLTVALYDGAGHAIPMCQGCWEAALDDRAVATLATARRALEAA